MSATAPATTNRCGGCTLCCRLLEVSWMESPAGDLCRECVAGEGCKLWPNPPAKCKAFACAWLQSGAHEDLRPDNIGLIFENIEDTFFLGTPAAGFELSGVVLRQIKSFLRQGYSVVLNMKPKKEVWLAKGHTQDGIQQLWRDLLQRMRSGVTGGDLRN